MEKFSLVKSPEINDKQLYVAHNYFPRCVFKPIWKDNEWMVQRVDTMDQGSTEEFWQVSIDAIMWLYNQSKL